MKTVISSFGSAVLSREQMKEVKGGLRTSYEVRCYNAADELLGSIDLGTSCSGGGDQCREKYKDFDNATCYCG